MSDTGVKVNFQTFVHEPGMGQDTVGIHKVEIISSGRTATLSLPGRLADVQVLASSFGTTIPAFYVRSGATTAPSLKFVKATIGSTWMVVSRHRGTLDGDLS